jgi:tryptophan synthase alpha chain
MGINRIERAFQKLRETDSKAFIPYIMGGDGETAEYIQFFHDNGATLIEIGIPFSDPVADGPTIQQAGLRAMGNKVRVDDILQMIELARTNTDIPIVLMTYLNPILAYGIERFMQRCQEVGVDGFIIPDLPYEEQQLVTPHLRNMALIPLVTLTSTDDRLEKIIEDASGFIYAVTVRGVTGGRTQFPEELTSFLSRLKEISALPILAGFGISTSAHIEQLIPYCDGVVVGSKVVELLQERDIHSLRKLMQTVCTKIETI